MFSLTDTASTILAEVLEEHRQNDDDVLRLERRGDEFGLVLDQQRDRDEVYQQNEKPVLVLNDELTEHLAEAAMDVVEAPEGYQLKLMAKDDADAQ